MRPETKNNPGLKRISAVMQQCIFKNCCEAGAELVKTKIPYE